MSRSSRYRTVPTGTQGTKENPKTMKRRLILLSLLVIATLVASITAAGAQLDARDDPKITKQLSIDDRGPGSKKCEKDKDFTESGRPAVVSRACTYPFAFNPGKDKDPNRDYRVFWLQSSVHPRNNFCVTDVVSQITIPDGFRIESKTPRFKRTDSRKRVKVRLRVDGGGGRKNDQFVTQRFGLHPRTLRPDLDGNSLTVDWDGATRGDLGFAMGIAVSYPAEDLPQGRAHGEVNSVLRQNC
jgi:hypothetical protein